VTAWKNLIAPALRCCVRRKRQPNSDPACRPQSIHLLLIEHPGAREELQPTWAFQREGRTEPRRHVQHNLRVLPVLELLRGDVERRTACLTQSHITLTMRNSPSGKHIGALPSQHPPG